MEAMLAEEQRVATAMRAGGFSRSELRQFTYKSRGIYIDQVRRYQQAFPIEQMLTLSSEEMFTNPAAVLRSVFEFVGVQPNFRVSDLAARNVSKTRKDVPADVYRYLDDHFRQYNIALYEALGRDFNW
jgi:hypothetical protein